MEMEKQGYSGMERLMFFLIPILFTIILLAVLFALFNSNTRNKMLEVGSSVPGLSKLLPPPQSADTETAPKTDNTAKENEAKLAALQNQLKDAQSKLAAAAGEKTKQEDTIKDLQSRIDQLIRMNDEEALSEEQYQAKIADLSRMFANMTPSKAAPILQNMTLDEAALVLNSMSSDSRSGIMAKMDPKLAADVVMKLKDNVSAKDMQIAALQSRLQKEAAGSSTQTVLDIDQLKTTFGSMDPEAAAELLIKMADVSPSKVLRILNVVDSGVRSSIVAQMSDINNDITAQLVSKLLPGK
ncbi:magnesium transporter MgtE N-terminal domain-containing protein [Paenibacillus beijingensis]|nr:MgtE protein [Paenibacillus beijingensis]